MSRSRDYRRGKDGRAQDPFAERRRRFRPILRMLGADELFAATPRGFQEAVWRWKCGEPEVRGSAGVDVRIPPLIQRAMCDAKMRVEGLAAGDGAELTFRDLVAVAVPLRAGLQAVVGTPGMLPSVRRFLDVALPQLDLIWDRCLFPLFEAAGRATEGGVVSFGRADAGILSWTREIPPVRGKPQVQVTVWRTVPEEVEVRVDGAARRAYRVGAPMGMEGVRWASVPAELVGGARGETLPVFVQAHALRQLHERLDLPGMRPWAEYHLATSLLAPVRVDGRAAREGGGTMFEYCFQGQRMGYLVATRVGGRVLVRTFLLSTMAGTPEGDRLASRLRLTRSEAAWLGLHKLSSLAASDVRGDAELCGMLAECGCGPLVEIGRGLTFLPVAVGFASELRRYLGMAPVVGKGGAADEDDDLASGEVLREAA